jgi:hypothetical protein
MSHTSTLPLRTGQYHVPKKAKIRCEAKNVRFTTINRASTTEQKKKPNPSNSAIAGRGGGEFEGVEGGRGSLKETSTL